MTHDVTVSAAECGNCNGDIAQWTTREKESWVHMVHFEHLQAQKDAAYAAMEKEFGDNPIKGLLSHVAGSEACCMTFRRIAVALRAQMEAKR